MIETHFIPLDPRRPRILAALCGARVHRSQQAAVHLAWPSCENCQALLAEEDALADTPEGHPFGPAYTGQTISCRSGRMSREDED